MPTEPPVYRVTDVDLHRWASEGVSLLMIDVEACLGKTGSTELVPEYAQHINKAHEVIPNIALWTNKAIKSRKDRELLAGWGEQAGADLVLSPLDPSQRKPSPINAYKAMHIFGASADEVGVIDDKASAGIRGGHFAGMEHRAWTRSFGGNQHPGDLVVRRPLETALRLRAHMLLTPTIREVIAVEQATGENPEDISLAQIVDIFERGAVADGKDKVLGYGVDDVTLSDDILRLLRQPAYIKALDQVKDVYSYYSDSPAEKLKEFLYEHGRTTADALTYGRLALAGGIVAVNRMDLDPETKRILSAGLIVLGYLFDGADGWAARRHKHGATARGARDDQLIDKVLSMSVDIFALMPIGTLDTLDVVVRASRDVGMTVLRKPFTSRGMDTKSIWSGKVATTAVAVAQVSGITIGRHFPKTNRAIQHTATGLKVASALHGVVAWPEHHERCIHEANNRRREQITQVSKAI